MYFQHRSNTLYRSRKSAICTTEPLSASAREGVYSQRIVGNSTCLTFCRARIHVGSVERSTDGVSLVVASLVCLEGDACWRAADGPHRPLPTRVMR